MLFNSLIFLVFASLFFLVWKTMKGKVNAKLVWLTLASFVFYGWWDWRFIFLILFSGFIDYFTALWMHKYPHRKKLFLILSIIGNIGSLSLFKYSGFFAANLDALFNTSLSENINSFFLITPVGISFYTFQSMSYTIDVYKEKMKSTRNILQFFAYLSMFPQLVAGPIVRAKDMLPQLLGSRVVSKEDRWDGFRLIAKGYFKKMLIADNLAPIVVAAFSQSSINENSAFWWGAIIAFAFQIYCDFAGYSDIARGLARWMGYDFPDNFNHPYVSTSLRSFWSRWHISLSTWFRDYIYIPLGGNKGGKFRSHLNMWITMIVSGLWHGAAWTFVIWGALHALFLSIERILKWPTLTFNNQFVRFLAWLIVSVQVLVAWVFFRAESVSQALQIIKVMFSFKGDWFLGWELNGTIFILMMVVREMLVYTGIETKIKWQGRIGAVAEMIWYAILIALIIFFRGTGGEFIYFQF